MIQGRRLAWLTQIIQILAIEGAKRGFDRGAEAGYALPNTVPEKRRPNSRLHENFWATNGRGTSRMEFAIKLSALSCRQLIEIFCRHLSVTTLHTNQSALETHA